MVTATLEIPTQLFHIRASLRIQACLSGRLKRLSMSSMATSWSEGSRSAKAIQSTRSISLNLLKAVSIRISICALPKDLPATAATSNRKMWHSVTHMRRRRSLRVALVRWVVTPKVRTLPSSHSFTKFSRWCQKASNVVKSKPTARIMTVRFRSTLWMCTTSSTSRTTS